MYMQEWLNRFYGKEVEGITLTIKGRTYKRSDCEQIGGGSEKLVFKIKDETLCFFTPNKFYGEEQWNGAISSEKTALDHMRKLGLKTQQFEIVPIEIHAAGKPTYTANALLTKDFQNLCKEESLLIHNPKGGAKRHTGISPDFEAMKERFEDKKFVQAMFKKIINEYAIAYACALPINILQTNDDSEHICFELSANPDEAPVARYMFWDVANDVKTWPFISQFPTLGQLKKGPELSYRKNGPANHALKILAETVICAMPGFHDITLYNKIKSCVISAIDDDLFLNEALAYARTIVTPYFSDLFTQYTVRGVAINSDTFINYMLSAVSTENLELVQQCYQLRPKDNILSEKLIDKVMEASTKYGNKPIIDFLNSNLGVEKAKYLKEQKQNQIQTLQNKFLDKYNAKLALDKGAWCGLYSFFARSYINKDMALADMVKHAQGLSKAGSGNRSQSVMREMGWLDDNNTVCDEIREYVANC